MSSTHNNTAWNSGSPEQCKGDDERHQIVQRYIRGVSALEPGEVQNPQFQEENCDKFGFYHPNGISAALRNAELRMQALDIGSRRSKKWRHMLFESHGVTGYKSDQPIEHYSKWNSLFSSRRSKEKFVRRVYKGIPSWLRAVVWRQMLRIDDAKKASSLSYDVVKRVALESSPDIRQIDLDVNRTYRLHQCFHERYSPRQRMLFEVLAAYSLFNQDVGYCQGMSEITAFLLIYLEDEEAVFWALSRLMSDDHWAMHGLFTPDFPKLQRFIACYERILAKFHPRLHKHVHHESKGMGIAPTSYTVRWFLQCFLDAVPFALALRVWDIFMLEGDFILLAMALNIMRMHRKKLMRLDQEGLLMFLKEQLPKDFGYDEDEVVDQLKSCIEDLRQARLQPAKPSPAAERAHTAPGQLVAASLARRSAAPVSNNISGRQATSVVVEQRQPGAVAPDSRRSQASQRARSTSPISPVNAADGKAGGRSSSPVLARPNGHALPHQNSAHSAPQSPSKSTAAAPRTSLDGRVIVNRPALPVMVNDVNIETAL